MHSHQAHLDNHSEQNTLENQIDELDSHINDTRRKADFRSISFSEYKKINVKKELINAIIESKHDSACYWSAELVCAAHYDDLWETIIVVYIKFIHVSNPKLCIYLKKRWLDFTSVMNNGYAELELSARNSPKIRQLFCEVICVLCGSNKTTSINPIKLNSADFDMDGMKEKLGAADTVYIEELFRPQDPRELFMAYNEFVFHLGNGCNPRDACYWMEWMMEFEQKVALEKNACQCEPRGFIRTKIDPKFQTEVVWMIWDAFFTEASCVPCNKKIIPPIVDACLTLFTAKYTSGCYKKYKHMMYFLIQILTDPSMQSLSCEMISNKQSLKFHIENMDGVYAQIKMNEHSPNMDYLYTHGQQSNLDKTIANLEAMNKMSENMC